MNHWLFAYYSFIAKFCREPVDFEDFIDGTMAADILTAIDLKIRGI